MLLTKVTAQWLLLVPVLLVLWSVVQRRQWRFDLVEAALAGLLTVALVKLAGISYQHARPFVTYGRPPLVPHAPDNAFPSDHLAACGLAFIYLWTRQRAFAAIVLVCAAAIGAARVTALLHWPIDIAAGFLAGAVACTVAQLLLRRGIDMRS
jgi:undecaprenyl-diphosphatase